MLRSAMISVAMAFAALRCPAASPWAVPLFTGDPKAVLAAAGAADAKADVTVLELSMLVAIDSDGRATRTVREVKRVNTDAGAKASAQIGAAWFAWHQEKPQIKARVITADGQAHLLDPGTITEASVPSTMPGVFTDTKILAAPLPAIAAGSVTESETVVSDREAVASFGASGEVTVPMGLPLRHYRAVFEAPVSGPLVVETRGLPNMKRQEDKGGGKRRVTLEMSDEPARAAVPFLAPDDDSVARIAYSTIDSWGAVSRWYLGIVDKAAGVPASASAHAGADTVAKIEPLLEDLQKKVRYTGIELGASSYVPRTPAEVLARGYGDCKDKVVLLLSELRKAGIPAYPALLRAGRVPDALPNVPSFELFNHVIVYVPGEHPLWIDPTSEFTSAANIAAGDQGHVALIVDGSNKPPVRVPESAAFTNVAKDHLEILMAEEGRASLQGTVESTGAAADLLRAAMQAVDSATPDKRNAMNAAMAKALDGQRVTRFELQNLRELSKPFFLHIDIDGYNGAQTADQGASWLMPSAARMDFRSLIPLVLLARSSEQAAAKSSGERKADYFLAPAFTSIQQLHVVPPVGYALKQVPTFSALSLGPVSLQRSAVARPDGSLDVEYKLISPKARYTAAEGAAIVAGLKTLLPQAGTTLAFVNTAEQMITEGRVPEGLALMKKAAAEAAGSVETNSAWTIRLATLYAQYGARSEAAAALRGLIARDPKNAAAWFRLGWVYTHDEYGRQFRPGMNLAEAETAYSKAIELKPDNALYSLASATLLEFDADGTRFHDRARLDKAIVQFEAVGFDKMVSQNSIDNYPEALLFAGRYDDVKRFYEKPQAARASVAFKLAAMAAMDGPEAATEEADRTLASDPNRNARLQEAGRLLLHLRCYKAASALLAKGFPTNSGSSDFDPEMVAGIRKASEAGFSKEPSIAAVQKLVAALLEAPKTDEWKALIAPEWQASKRDEWRAGLLRDFARFRTIAGQPITFPAMTDYVVSAGGLVADCYNASNCRVRLPDTGNNGALKTIAYVVGRGDGYRVLQLGSAWAAPGGEALACLKRGDAEGARHWLDWAGDEIAKAQGSDPLSPVAFTKLWPPATPGDKAQTTAAAASLIARGKNFGAGLAELVAVKEQLKSPEAREAVDLATLQAYFIRRQYPKALPIAKALHAAHPESARGGVNLGIALAASGDKAGAEAIATALESKPATTLDGQRLRVRMGAMAGDFAGAEQIAGKICQSPQATAADWNEYAATSLFAEKSAPAKTAAAKANRLANGRNRTYLEVLALAEADSGQIADARRDLYRALDFIGPDANEGENLAAFGRMAEQLDLKARAAALYKQVHTPLEGESALTPYTYAQNRLKQMGL